VDNGTLSVEAPPAPSRADAYISADPAEWLLLMLGRRTPWHAMFTGKTVAWGRRPQALFTLLHTVSPP
jgi:putative sterol carrier protein